MLWKIGVKETFVDYPWAVLMPLMYSFMQFSHKDFIVDPDSKDSYTIKYRYFLIPLYNKKHSWNSYSYFVVKTLNVSYNLYSPALSGRQSNSHTEKSLTIVGLDKQSKETILICKGKKANLNSVVKEYIEPLNIPVYSGAKKKGYEYTSF